MYHHDRNTHARGSAFVVLLAVLCLTVSGAGLGFWLGYYADAEMNAGEILAADAVENEDVNAMAVRLADMQAELLRLNALGERLVKMANLDPTEFDFVNPPPQGGAERGRVRDYTIKELAAELGGVVDALVDRQRKLDVLDELLVDKELSAAATPSSWPVRSGYISSPFGYRVHPTKHVRMFHEGVDIASARGTPITSVADGVVIYSGTRRGYGRVVDIRHDNGLVTRYAHNTKNVVEEGQRVFQGDKIATVGATGTATGPHLHFEVLNNDRPLNPVPYLNSNVAWRSGANTLASYSMR
ncbi:M23 family metallopeptidase [Chromatium okenii]|uniref:M23 family metallopeptidase n=1 Tax=Chromatium okenii TaxID=61644 RepID=UPI0026EE18F9|nr:M23 family metallopeptidase [Chromatium okenii]MBV5311403.1 M23 family metallopeptidase [Chromatium okenii]